jgi:hypothetical protein
LQAVNPLEHPDWDAPLTRRPDFSFFHGRAWASVLAQTYGFAPVWQVQGESMLPLMEVRSWLTGRRGIGLPFTDDCAPLCRSAGEFQPLFDAAVQLGRSRGWKSIELRGGRRLLGGDAVPASLSYYGHGLRLGGDEGMFGKMDGSVRQAVRKAETGGVTVEILQSRQAVRDFYFLQCLTRKRHGLPPQPWRFFLNIWQHVLSQNQGIVALARWHGTEIAGAVYLYLGDKAVYKYGASDFRFQHLRPNNLVMWEAMRWLARRGVVSLHLGKTSPANEGLRRFKLHLGSVEERIEYVKFDLLRNRFEVDADDIAGWHNRVFRRLPVFLSRTAGEWLYRHWA